MITPMKKVSVLCLKKDAPNTLEQLRELGVLHVITSAQPGDTLANASERVHEASLALDTLHAFEKPFEHHKTSGDCDPDACIRKIVGLHERRTHLEEKLLTLQHTRHTLEPFGDFDPETIARLGARGIVVKLYHVRDLEALAVPEGVQLHVLSKDKQGSHLAAISDADFSLEAARFQVPGQSLTALNHAIATARQQRQDINNELHELTRFRATVEKALLDRKEVEHYAKVHDSMGCRERIVWLNGFCPADAVESIRQTAARTGLGLVIETPSAEDTVPTLLKLPAWTKPIKAVFSMLSILPGYRESDISGVFLVFFSIFFAILIGDAGYGMLFLGITLFARFKMRKAPAYPFVLFGILSICTILWGALTGNWFGLQPEILPGLLQKTRLDLLTGEKAQENVITLCFLIGAIHLTIAHAWNAIALAPAIKALAQVGWIGLVWSMYLVAMNMVLGKDYPAWFLPLFLTSLALILVFMTEPKALKKEWIQHAMFPLSVVNCFVDIVSYIRLFAVGMASLSVAQSFNGMAGQIGLGNIWTVPLVALILLLGHGLNIILCALGILVHGVRLNTLEFSLHKNIEWKGVPYQPFARLERTPVS